MTSGVYVRKNLANGQKCCPRCKKWKNVSEFYPCKHSVNNLDTYCKSCSREMSNDYRITHLEQLNKRRREHRITHREEMSRLEKTNRSVHHDEILKRKAVYRSLHRKELNELSKAYQATHKKTPEQYAEYNHRRRARKINAAGNGITARQWCNLKEEYGYLCAYCNQKKPLAMDHVVPFSKGGRHDINNIVPACQSCNSSKKDSSLLMFLYRRATEVPQNA